MVIDAKLQKTGYVPGESIPVHLKIKNETSVDIKEILISFNLLASSQSRKSAKSNIRDLQKFILGQRKISSTSKILGEFIETIYIPPCPPTTKTGICELVQLSYEVDIHVVVAGPHQGPKMSLPVVIGLIPLGARPLSSPNSCNLAEFDCRPPTYESCSFMAHANLIGNNEDVIEDTVFLPMYPKYTKTY